jgi:hypothetical protein
VKEVEIRVKQKAKEEVEAERKSMRDLMKGEMEELQTHLSMFEKVITFDLLLFGLELESRIFFLGRFLAQKQSK